MSLLSLVLRSRAETVASPERVRQGDVPLNVMPLRCLQLHGHGSLGSANSHSVYLFGERMDPLHVLECSQSWCKQESNNL